MRKEAPIGNKGRQARCQKQRILLLLPTGKPLGLMYLYDYNWKILVKMISKAVWANE